MDPKIPDYSDEELVSHEVVREFTARCTEASRLWIEGKVSRRYLNQLTGAAGICIEAGKSRGLGGDKTSNAHSKEDASLLLGRLTEAWELLRYPRYAAAELESNTLLSDTAETRRRLIAKHVDEEPGISFPSP